MQYILLNMCNKNTENSMSNSAVLKEHISKCWVISYET